MFSFRESALQAINDAKSIMDSIREFSPMLAEKAESILSRAKEEYKVEEYLLAKCYARKVYEMREKINPVGIVIDGYSEDWTERYEPLTVDKSGDIPNEGQDVASVYVVNDQNNLYLMFEFGGEPKAGVALWFDTNSDELWDYHVKCIAEKAFVGKMIKPDYCEITNNLQYAYGHVIEVSVPLDLIGQPSTARMQIASWDEKRKQLDKVDNFNWVTYELS
jgi:hypothetical protein